MKLILEKWTTYAFVVAIATYWLTSLLLWYPWSYDPLLGMTLMFLAITPVWIYSVYHCLKRSHSEKLIHGAIHTAVIFGVVAIILDFIFYGIIRGAMTELYHPTTLYGYAFLISLPFLEIYLLKGRLQRRTDLKKKEFINAALVGFTSFLAIILIIIFGIRLPEGVFRFLTLIFASLIVFNLVLWIVLRSTDFKHKINRVILLSILCVIIGMLLGKYGAGFRLKWWIYYPVPLLMNVLLPPIILKMDKKQIVIYLFLSLMSAPFIHFVFSFFFNWTEYMPFWEIPHYKTLLN